MRRRTHSFASFAAAELLEDRRLLAAAGEVVLFDFEGSQLPDAQWLAAQPAGTAAAYVGPKGDSGNDILKLAPGEGRNGSQALLVESPDAEAGVPGFWVLKNQSTGTQLSGIMDERGYLAPRGVPVNRLSFWIRFEKGFRTADGADPKNLHNFVVGTYHYAPGKIGQDRVVESDNWHFYYQLVLRHDLAGDDWIHVVLNTTPTHQRSLSLEREAIDPTQPHGSLWELATRFYLDLTPYFDAPEKEYPARMWVDDISMFYEPDPYQIQVRLGDYMEGEFLDVGIGQSLEVPVHVTNRGTAPVSGKLVLAARGVVRPVLLDPLTNAAPGPLTLAPGETRQFLFRVAPNAETEGGKRGSGVFFIPDGEARPGNYSKSTPYMRLDQYYGVTGPADAINSGAWMRIVSQAPRQNHVPRIQGGLTVQTGPDRVAKLSLDARDADGDPVTYELRSQSPVGGRVSLDPRTGVATFVPEEGFTGVFWFNYGVTDGKESSLDARSWFYVDAGYAPPLDPSVLRPRNDRAAILLANGDTRVAGNVLANDEGGGTSLGVVQVDGRGDLMGAKVPGRYGDFYLQTDGQFEYRLHTGLPVVEALGLGETLSDAVAYEVSDGVDVRAAILRVRIEGRNHVPRASDDRNLVARGIVPDETSGTVLGNDWDFDGDTLRVAEVAGVALPAEPGGGAVRGVEVRGAYGTFHFLPEGTYRYVLDNRLPVVAELAEGQLLEDVVRYTVSDGIDAAQAFLKVLVTAPAAAETHEPTSSFTVLDFEDTKLHDEPWLLQQPEGTVVPYIRPVGKATVQLAAGAGRSGSNAVLIEAASAAQGMPAAFVLKNLKGARTIANLTDDRGYLLPRGQQANRLEFWVRFDENVRRMHLAAGNQLANLRVVTYHHDPAATGTRVVESDNWSFTHDLQVRLDEAGSDWVHVVLAPNPDAQRNNPSVGWNPTASQGEYWELLTRFTVELVAPAQVDPASYPLKMWLDEVKLSEVPDAARVQVRMEGYLPGQLVSMPRLAQENFRVTIKNPTDKTARGILRAYGSNGVAALLLDPVALAPLESSITLAPGEVREAVVRLSLSPTMAANATAIAGCEFVSLEELRPANRSQVDWRVLRPGDGDLVSPADATVAAAMMRVRVVAEEGNDRPTVEAGQVFAGEMDTPLSGQLVAVDPEGDAIRYALDGQPTRGRIELEPETGRFVFTPEPGFLGTVRWKYTALDAGGASRAGVSWIRVDERSVPPLLPGDANRDGLFNTTDLVLVFQAGRYEDGVVGGTTWEEGDWTGDGEFNTTDLVAAFQGGQFEAPAGARPQAATTGRGLQELPLTSGWGRGFFAAEPSPVNAGTEGSSANGAVAWLDEAAGDWDRGAKRSKKSTRSTASATDAVFSRLSARSDLGNFRSFPGF